MSVTLKPETETLLRERAHRAGMDFSQFGLPKITRLMCRSAGPQTMSLCRNRTEITQLKIKSV